MSQTDKYIRQDSRRHKTDETEQYLEDRAQLLDTIREMINVEIDRRGGCMQGGTIPPKTSTRRRTPKTYLPTMAQKLDINDTTQNNIKYINNLN